MKNPVWAELTAQRSPAEVFRRIPESVHLKICAALLCVLAATPILAVLLTEPVVSVSRLTNRMYAFNALKNSVGYAGLLVGLYLLLWRRFNRPEPLRNRLRRSGLPLCLAAMLLWSCLSCALSTDPDTSFWGSAVRMDGLTGYFSYAGIFILAAQLTRRELLRPVVHTMTATAAILALVCLLNNSALLAYFQSGSDRAIFMNQNHYGYYLCMALPAALWLFLDARGAASVLCAAEAALLSNSLIRCGSLGPLLAVLCAYLAVLLLIFFRERKKLPRALALVLLSLAVMGVSAAGVWDIGGELKTLQNEAAVLAEGLGGKAESEALDAIGHERGSLWVNALRFIRERPLFGYGPDNLGDAYAAAGCASDRPHNEILQFAASLGVPAALFYLAGLACLLAGFLRRFRRLGAWEIGSFAVVGSYLISSLFGNTMFYTSPYFFLFLGLAFSQLRLFDSPAAA